VLRSFRISGSGMTAQRLRMDVIANNVANAQTTRTPAGGPYRRQAVVFVPASVPPAPETGETRLVSLTRHLYRQGDPESSGVEVAYITADRRAPRRVYEPNHPDADADGFVNYPNVDIVTEITDMLAATRAYEANVTAFNAAKAMALRALELGRI
jgi:flagellar basal-body rod protein FlgC